MLFNIGAPMFLFCFVLFCFFFFLLHLEIWRNNTNGLVNTLVLILNSNWFAISSFRLVSNVAASRLDGGHLAAALWPHAQIVPMASSFQTRTLHVVTARCEIIDRLTHSEANVFQVNWSTWTFSCWSNQVRNLCNEIIERRRKKGLVTVNQKFIEGK